MTRKFWITALTFGAPWTCVMIVFNLLVKEAPALSIISSTIIGGLVGGVVFAAIMQYTANKLYKKTIVATAENETIIKEGGANHVRGKEGVGGKLVLTDRRLIFKSHKFNIQNHEIDFDLTRVAKLQASKTFRILENVLNLDLNNNDRHKFIVDEPTHWIEKITNQKRLTN